MKRLFPLSFSFLLYFISFSQEECSKMKCAHKQLKSNRLTVEQIEETKKYDVHYYFLDVSLTNLVSDIAGTVEIHATANQILDSALLELFETFTITDIRVNSVSVSYNRDAQMIRIPVNVNTSESFIIAIDYNGIPPTTGTNPMAGSGLTNMTDNDYNVQVTASLSEPFSAYEWWPSKQYLGDKADSCAVYITVPNNCMAGSNGLLQNVVDLGNGSSRYEWKHNHPIAYYLISVAVAEYMEYNTYAYPIGSPAPVLIQNYIFNKPEVVVDWLNAIDSTALFMELFSALYGTYPFYDEKYGHCMAPIGGGMEHQTMTTQQNFGKNLTAHELAHQWFGNNVTCASWADIWVNEGFATYTQYLMLEHLHPYERAQQMQNYHNAAMQYFDGQVYVDDTLSAGRIFNYRLTYAKGAAIINTMRFVINNDYLFFQGLRNFQNHFADSVATGLDVQAELENISGIDLTNVFQEWYYGEGYPTYNVKWNVSGHDLSLEIAQYPSSFWQTPLFTNPLEISFTRENMSDTTIRFEVTDLVNQYYLQHIDKITGVAAIDPYNWVINSSDTIIHDPNFIASPSSSFTIPDVEISPNPSDGAFFIVARTQGKHIMKVIDSSGKLVFEKSFDSETTFDLSNYAKGMYLVLVESEYGEKSTSKVIKK